MRKHLLRIIVALVTFLMGLLLAQLVALLHTPKVSAPPYPVSAASASPTPAATPLEIAVDDGAEFPDDSDLEPYTIKSFINEHPHANLHKLWERLHVKKDKDWDFENCSECKAEIVEYALSDGPHNDVILNVTDSDGVCFWTRFMVFSRQNRSDRWRLLGNTDAVARFDPAQYVVLVTDEKPWLVITGQSGWGNGFSAYETRLFKVTKQRLTEFFSFGSAGFQAGTGSNYTQDFDSRILSCQTRDGQTTIKVEFSCDYTFFERSDVEIPLFSKRQIAVFVKPHNGNAVLDEAHSSLTKHELDHIYQTDSMTEADFLKYNHSELLNLATRGNAAQKKWLRAYLKECDNSSEKRQLLAALAN